MRNPEDLPGEPGLKQLTQQLVERAPEAGPTEYWGTRPMSRKAAARATAATASARKRPGARPGSYFDALYVKSREEGAVKTEAVFPRAQVRPCIVHKARGVKYAP